MILVLGWCSLFSCVWANFQDDVQALKKAKTEAAKAAAERKDDEEKAAALQYAKNKHFMKNKDSVSKCLM